MKKLVSLALCFLLVISGITGTFAFTASAEENDYVFWKFYF